MVNKYKNLQQVVLIQRQYKLLKLSLAYTNKLMDNRQIIVYKTVMKDIIPYDSKINTFTFHHEKI